MRVEFFMPMVPPKVTHQEKKVAVRNGKPEFYEPSELKAARIKLTAHLSRHVPEAPLVGPLQLVTKWCWPVEGTDHVDGEWYCERPDTHNAVKLPVDIMETLGFFGNDKRICFEVIQKFWAKVPGIYVCVEELT
jgi:Holliday junction resolvase RusA-like endonuclease